MSSRRMRFQLWLVLLDGFCATSRLALRQSVLHFRHISVKLFNDKRDLCHDICVVVHKYV